MEPWEAVSLLVLWFLCQYYYYHLVKLNLLFNYFVRNQYLACASLFVPSYSFLFGCILMVLYIQKGNQRWKLPGLICHGSIFLYWGQSWMYRSPAALMLWGCYNRLPSIWLLRVKFTPCDLCGVSPVILSVLKTVKVGISYFMLWHAFFNLKCVCTPANPAAKWKSLFHSDQQQSFVDSHRARNRGGVCKWPPSYLHSWVGAGVGRRTQQFPVWGGMG